MADKTIEIDLQAKYVQFTEAMDKAGQSTEKLGKEVGGLKGTLDSLKSAVGRGSTFREFTDLFIGGAVAGGIMAAGNLMKDFTGKIVEARDKFAAGQIGADEMVAEIASGIPILGGFVQAGENIVEMFTGAKAAAAALKAETAAAAKAQAELNKEVKAGQKQIEEESDERTKALRSAAQKRELAEAPADQRDGIKRRQDYQNEIAAIDEKADAAKQKNADHLKDLQAAADAKDLARLKEIQKVIGHTGGQRQEELENEYRRISDRRSERAMAGVDYFNAPVDAAAAKEKADVGATYGIQANEKLIGSWAKAGEAYLRGLDKQVEAFIKAEDKKAAAAKKSTAAEEKASEEKAKAAIAGQEKAITQTERQQKADEGSMEKQLESYLKSGFATSDQVTSAEQRHSGTTVQSGQKGVDEQARAMANALAQKRTEDTAALLALTQELYRLQLQAANPSTAAVQTVDIN